jgi:hypothetical protein
MIIKFNEPLPPNLKDEIYNDCRYYGYIEKYGTLEISCVPFEFGFSISFSDSIVMLKKRGIHEARTSRKFYGIEEDNLLRVYHINDVCASYAFFSSVNLLVLSFIHIEFECWCHRSYDEIEAIRTLES